MYQAHIQQVSSMKTEQMSRENLTHLYSTLVFKSATLMDRYFSLIASFGSRCSRVPALAPERLDSLIYSGIKVNLVDQPWTHDVLLAQQLLSPRAAGRCAQSKSGHAKIMRLNGHPNCRNTFSPENLDKLPDQDFSSPKNVKKLFNFKYHTARVNSDVFITSKRVLTVALLILDKICSIKWL